jgi:hypothetical protein
MDDSMLPAAAVVVREPNGDARIVPGEPGHLDDAETALAERGTEIKPATIEVRDALAVLAFTLFALLAIAGGFTISLAGGLISASLVCLVTAVVAGWRSD